jgi:hypothetical protein
LRETLRSAQRDKQFTMKIIKNEKLIKRNGMIGQVTTIAALLVLGGGMFLSFRNPNDPRMFTYSLAALAGGFLLTQIGIHMGNRWGRSPRPDESLDASLKGLPGDYSIYHYVTPASHVLLGPAGMWVLLPYSQRGIITYSKKRWRVSQGGFLQAYMSLFGAAGLGRPDLEAEGDVYSIRKHLAKSLDENEIPSIQAALVFTNEAADIQAEDVPMPALKLKQIKDFMRQKAKEKPISQTQLVAVKAALPTE